MDGGAWWATVHGVAKGWTLLSDFTFTFNVAQLVTSASNAGHPGSISRWGRSPGGGHNNPLQYFLPGEFYGHKSLAGYSPRGGKESDMKERK